MDRILTLTKSKLDNLLDAAYNRGYADAKYNVKEELQHENHRTQCNANQPA